jgi:hypothetical protein
MDALHDTHLFLGALSLFLLVVLGILIIKELLYLYRERKMLEQINRDLKTGFEDN